MNIYISNISTQVTNEDLKTLFTPFGQVASAEISIDSFTDKPRGFGYVTMPEEEEGRAAIAALNQKELNGARINVQESEVKNVQKGSYKVGSGAVNVYRFKKN